MPSPASAHSRIPGSVPHPVLPTTKKGERYSDKGSSAAQAPFPAHPSLDCKKRTIEGRRRSHSPPENGLLPESALLAQPATDTQDQPYETPTRCLLSLWWCQGSRLPRPPVSQRRPASGGQSLHPPALGGCARERPCAARAQ